MRKQIYLNVLWLVMVLLLVACTSATRENASAVAIASPLPPASTPTATPTPLPSPTHTHTPTATVTPLPTLTPTPTRMPCDLALIDTAITNISRLSSYRNRFLISEAQSGDEYEVTNFADLNFTVLQEQGVVTAMEISFSNPSNPINDAQRIIMIDDVAYVEIGPGQWETWEGELASNLIESLKSRRFVDPELVDVFGHSRCVQMLDFKDNRITQVYRFFDIPLEQLSAFHELLADNPVDRVETVTGELWLQETEGLMLPVYLNFGATLISDGVEIELESFQMLWAFNESVAILPPGGFFYEIPLPEDAEIIEETTNTLAFVVETTAEKMVEYYTAVLEADGWTLSESSIAEQGGLSLEIFSFQRGDQDISFGAANSRRGGTIVIFVGGDF